MSTRARIGVELSDGSILSAYHHWDGYPSWLGVKLQEHFNTKELASELIDGGDMSVCYTTERWNKEPNEHGGATKHEVEDYGPQYYSERGENTPPRLDVNLSQYLDKDNNEEYGYVYTNNGWVCYDMNSFDYRKQPEIVEIPEACDS